MESRRASSARSDHKYSHGNQSASASFHLRRPSSDLVIRRERPSDVRRNAEDEAVGDEAVKELDASSRSVSPRTRLPPLSGHNRTEQHEFATTSKAAHRSQDTVKESCKPRSRHRRNNSDSLEGRASNAVSEDQGKPETPGREEKPPRRPQITSRRFLATAPASSAATSGSPPEGGKPPPGADPESLTPWQVNNSVKELHSVVHSHDVSALQKELADDSLRAVINVPHPESGRTALHEAVASVLPDVASHLLDCGADPNVAHPQEGCSLLHAAAWGNAQLIRLLTDHGANVNSADPAGYTALHYASKGGHAGAVKELLGQGASVRAKTGEGATPLEMAANTRVRLLFNPAGDGSDERGNSSSASGQGSPAKGEEESGKDEGHEDDMGSPQLRRVRRRQEEESQRRDSGGGQEERERMREVLEAAGNIASAMERRGAEEEGKELRSQVEMFQGGVEMDTGGMQWSKGEMLGQGAYGEVYAGLNRRTGELMAVKHIKGDERSEELREMEREIEVCKQLRHKHIVGYIACQRVSPSELYVFLEYVPGGSITQMLVRFGRFEAGLVAHYTRQILHGLEYLHGKRIVHRDLKGGNALVTRSGVIKLADFGAAKALTDQSFNSTNRSLKGSLLWMPPEVVRGHDCTTRGDIWSLACTTVEMFTAKPPWPHITNAWAAIFEISKTKEGPPRPENAPEEANAFLSSCFKVDPQERPTAAKLLQEPFVAHSEAAMKEAQSATSLHHSI